MVRLRWQKRVKVLPGMNLNMSKSGISRSYHMGRLTRNSSGRTSMRVGKGVWLQGGSNKKGITPWSRVWGGAQGFAFVLGLLTVALAVGALILAVYWLVIR